MAKVKGVALMSRIGIIKRSFGDAAWLKVLDSMSARDRETLERGMLASSWYPEELYRDLNLAIDKALGVGNPNLFLKIGEMTGEEGLTGVYSSKVKADVMQTVERAPGLWRMFHATGDVKIETVGENHVRVQISGYAMPHREHCKGLGGWIRKIVELSGGKNPIQRETKCVVKGDSFCEWELRWE